MLKEVPILIPEQGWYVDDIDKENCVELKRRKASPDEVLRFNSDPCRWMDLRARWELYKYRELRKVLDSIHGYTPGVWRGVPNPCCVKPATPDEDL